MAKHINIMKLVPLWKRYCFIFFLAFFFITFTNANGQSIKEFYRFCNIAPLNSKFSLQATPLPYENDRYGYGINYRLNCESLKSLYNLPIIRAYLQVTDDTVHAINIYLPFDTALIKRMEKDLGPAENAWMAFALERVDTAGIIRDKRWFTRNLCVILSCTRYMQDLSEPKEDIIRIAILQRRKPLIKSEN
jgi:hypothetical protein